MRRFLDLSDEQKRQAMKINNYVQDPQKRTNVCIGGSTSDNVFL